MSIFDIQEELTDLYNDVSPFEQRMLDEVYDVLNDIDDDEQIGVRNTMLYTELVDIILQYQFFFVNYPDMIQDIMRMFQERIWRGIPLHRHMVRLQTLIQRPQVMYAAAPAA